MVEMDVFTPLKEDTDLCGSEDPTCENGIDIAVFYTPAFVALLGGDLQVVEDAIAHALYLANQSLSQSILPPSFQYRLVGFGEFPYEERDNLKADLVFLRNNPVYQGRRKELGADIGVIFFGTAAYGGISYSNTGTGPTSRIEGWYWWMDIS